MLTADYGATNPGFLSDSGGRTGSMRGSARGSMQGVSTPQSAQSKGRRSKKKYTQSKMLGDRNRYTSATQLGQMRQRADIPSENGDTDDE